MKTYGIYLTTIKGISIKDDKDDGWVADLKQQFARNARPERLLTLDSISVIKNAARNGEIKLEVTPMLDGEPLQPVMMPVNLRGNITIDDEGAVTCTTRVTFDTLELSGIGIDALLSSSLCLECKASDQPTLEESIQKELQEGVLEGQEPMLRVQSVVEKLADEAGPGVTVTALIDGREVARSTSPEAEEDGSEMPLPLNIEDIFDGDDMPFGPGAAD